MIITPENVDSARAIFYIFAFLFGASWGSFLNVVIYRLPAGLSVVKPASRCPSCETPIRGYDNIPILSWFILRGECRACHAPFSIRYALIELFVALLSTALAVKVLHDRLLTTPLSELLIAYLFLFIFIAALVALFFIDLDVTELPPEITIPMILVGVAYAFVTPEVGPLSTLTPNVDLSASLLGALIGGGLIFLIFATYYILTGRIGMGGGDLWMMAMVGAFVGWQGLLFIFMASSLQGIVVAFAALALGARQQDAEPGLFRNNEVAAIEAELQTSATPAVEDAGVMSEDADAGLEPEEGAEDPDDSAEDATSAADPALTEGAEEDALPPGVGKLAVPFGPFIALSAVEYVFLGHIILPFLTNGVLGPNGFLGFGGQTL